MKTRTSSEYLKSLDGEAALKKLDETDAYFRQYRALVALAAASKDDESHDNLCALACATYAWMPTILKEFCPTNFNHHAPLAAIRALVSSTESRFFLEAMENDAPINRSWVGTSKLLHFLNPHVFPIWDSRVASRFGLQRQSEVNRKGTYLEYFDFIHDEIAVGHHWIAPVSTFFSKRFGYQATDVRCLELMLFSQTNDEAGSRLE